MNILCINNITVFSQLKSINIIYNMANKTEFFNKLINDIIADYKKKSLNILSTNKKELMELEIRYKNINKEFFITVFNTLLNNDEFDKPILECTVNIIIDNPYGQTSKQKTVPQYIRKLTYDKGQMISDSNIEKSKINSVHFTDTINYSINLSHEKEIPPFPLKTNGLLRFKIRVSFNFVGGMSPAPARWRFDLTAVVKSTISTNNKYSELIKNIKQKLFTKDITATNILSELDYDIIDSYEIEIEYIGTPQNLTIEDISIVKKIVTIINPQQINDISYQEEIYHVAKYIIDNRKSVHLFKNSTHRLKQLTNRVIALNKNIYYKQVYPPHGYFITEKADGLRVIISINGSRCRLILGDSMTEIILDSFVPGNITIVDAELVYFTAGSTDKFTVYIFDVMVINNNNISNKDFSIRIGFIEDAVNIINKIISHTGSVAIPKIYKRLDGNNLQETITGIMNTKFSYTIDGLIMTNPVGVYSETKNYKWKSYENNTIDFLAIKCPSDMVGKAPYMTRDGFTLYILAVGITYQMREKLGIGLIPQYNRLFTETSNYQPIQFSPSINPLAYIYYHDNKLPDVHHQVIELRRDNKNENWLFVTTRDDRKLEKNYYGNDYRIAEITYMNYIDKFTIDNLWNINDGYFTKIANDIYVAPNKYNRFVISLLLKSNFSNAKWIIDQAAGRGADLHRYSEIGVENALFIDIDSSAIAELIQRKFSLSDIKRNHAHKWFNDKHGGANYIEPENMIIKDIKSLTIHTLVADLKMSHDKLISNILQYNITPGNVDGIVCNFAIHYMCDTIEHIRNILLFNVKMLKIGGKFIFTVLDGEAVFNIVKNYKIDQRWIVKENLVNKYIIQKKFDGDNLTAAGQTISVLLPFSDDLYDEPLCNINNMIEEARVVGFDVDTNESMIHYMNKFSEVEKILYNKLTDDDKKYIEMFRYVILKRVR